MKKKAYQSTRTDMVSKESRNVSKNRDSPNKGLTKALGLIW